MIIRWQELKDEVDNAAKAYHKLLSEADVSESHYPDVTIIRFISNKAKLQRARKRLSEAMSELEKFVSRI